MLTEDIKYSVLAQVFGKVPTVKSLVSLFTVKAFGEIMRNPV